MYSFSELLSNFPLIMAMSAWVVAQIIKFLLTLLFYRDELNFKILMSSGGMPSSHTATVCALSTSVALIEGFASPLFAACVVFSFIVMYDAAGVRRSAGEQAQTLNQVILHLFDNQQIPINTSVREIFGHTPVQVFVGAVIGILMPLIVNLFI